MTTAQQVGVGNGHEFRQQMAIDADERHQPILEAFRAGKSQREIARDFGMTDQRVSAIIKRARERGLLPPA